MYISFFSHSLSCITLHKIAFVCLPYVCICEKGTDSLYHSFYSYFYIRFTTNLANHFKDPAVFVLYIDRYYDLHDALP